MQLGFKAFKFFLVVCGFAIACSKKNDPRSANPSQDFVPDHSLSVAGLIKEKGPPLQTVDLMPPSKDAILVYPNNEKFQVRGDSVVLHSREPKGDEIKLQYWRHLWRGQNYLTQTADPDVGLKFNLPSRHLQILYNPKSDRVERVYEL